MAKDKEDQIAENMTDLVRIINAKGDTGEIRNIIENNESVQNEENSSSNRNEPGV